jgi:hypothetical protein
VVVLQKISVTLAARVFAKCSQESCEHFACIVSELHASNIMFCSTAWTQRNCQNSIGGIVNIMFIIRELKTRAMDLDPDLAFQVNLDPDPGS